MKLYATTTSERASKGQGGEWLAIEVKDADRNVIAVLRIADGKIGIWHDEKLRKVLTTDLPYKVEAKGNKQKTA